ncbi:MAG: hypothetical protein OXE94_08355 [Aestuariivita sp.]|nr:hypothetical protein [Aestuariivita sp.]MCY4202531.1 hypothetical protein [Aestuariivita sp.]MCY4289671.1 hypothetical protein [Aestuariivita sp.]MCY4346031.1 hypothetical protein [Aestuariivita sp.]
MSKTTGIQPVAGGIDNAHNPASGRTPTRINAVFTDRFGLYPQYHAVE